MMFWYGLIWVGGGVMREWAWGGWCCFGPCSSSESSR